VLRLPVQALADSIGSCGKRDENPLSHRVLAALHKHPDVGRPWRCRHPAERTSAGQRGAWQAGPRTSYHNASASFSIGLSSAETPMISSRSAKPRARFDAYDRSVSSNHPSGIGSAWREWMRPPRPHGDVIEARTVSFLELFYDLVFVVFVSQVAHALAAHPDRLGVRSFVVLFTLVWYTWLNGTLYHDLHGSDDGRSRIYMFVQMALIALMSVYAGKAPYVAEDGRPFAILLAVLLVWLTYQWWVVRRQDDPQARLLSTPYFIGLGVILALVVASIAVEDETVRLMLWAVGAAAAIVVPLAGGVWRSEGLSRSFRVSESLAERFALFTIIVLGEVVVGVVDGLTVATAGWATKGVGLLCLSIGFGIWWNYFDFVGRRPPRSGIGVRGLWLVMHLPLSMSVAATGAGMVSLIEHATDHQTPVATAWLIGGSMAVLCASLSVVVSLVPQRPGAKMVGYSLAAAALAALVAAAVQPRPSLLAAVLVALLSFVWIEAFVRHARLGEPFVPDAEST
jgi:low temperature requirement protein LtrA